ncbi:MAG: ATP-binding protein, partial [Bryobacteraceae bacterium]
EELALHILDIAENSIAAGARHVEIRVTEDPAADLLTVEIRDNGRGMAEQVVQRAADPFFTTKGTRRVGLGLSLLEQAACAAGGSLRIESRPGAGTTVTAEFQHSHPDRQPLGDVAATLLTLAAGHPEVEFSYEHCGAGFSARFSTADVKRELAGAPLNSPAGISALRRWLAELSDSLRRATRQEVSHGTGDH